jgi:hypothetical protein
LGLENWKIGAYKAPTIVKSLADKTAKFVKAGTTHSFVATGLGFVDSLIK